MPTRNNRGSGLKPDLKAAAAVLQILCVAAAMSMALADNVLVI
jgi:K+-transporting ATPase c subunit